MLKKILLSRAGFSYSAVLVLAVMLSSMALADSVSLTEESGGAGDTVVVTFEYTGDGSQFALQADVEISDPDAFSNIDVSNICSGSTAGATSCVLNSDGDRILISAANGSSTPLESFSGTAEFTIDTGATEGDVVTLSFVPAADGTFTPETSTDGSITIEAAAADESELAVTPSSHDFGTINVGDSDSTTFTAENVGDADLEITDVSIDGDGQFTITGDNCNGETLSVGDTCDVEVTFSPDSEDTFNAEITFESDADNNGTIVVQVTGEGVEDDNGAEEGFTVDFDGGLGAGDAGDTLDSTGTVDYVGDTSGSLSCELSGDPVFSSNPDPLDFTFAESDSADFTIYCDLPEDAEDGQDYGGALSCTDENDEVVYSGELSCSVTADEPEPTPAVPVPTMQSWGIALFSLIMLAIGGLSIRAFRS